MDYEVRIIVSDSAELPLDVTIEALTDVLSTLAPVQSLDYHRYLYQREVYGGREHIIEVTGIERRPAPPIITERELATLQAIIDRLSAPATDAEWANAKSGSCKVVD